MIKPTMSHAVNKEQLNELLVKYYEKLLREISSRTAVKSIMVDDGCEDQKMAVLIEDIQDLLELVDQV